MLGVAPLSPARPLLQSHPPWGLTKTLLLLGLAHLAPQPVHPGLQLSCVTPGQGVCSGSASVFLLITLFLHLGNCFYSPHKPRSLRLCVLPPPPRAKALGRPLAF